MLGYDIFFVGSPIVSAVLVAALVALVVDGVVYAGVVGTHELPRAKALAVVGTVYAFWLATAGIVVVGLSTA
jgi:hypothetical protein